MSTMTGLWVAGVALILLSLAVLLPPLLAEVSPTLDTDQDVVLRSLYHAQRAELASDLQAGRLSGADHAQAVQELERRLWRELEGRSTAVAARSSRWWRHGSALVLSVLLPVGAVGLYVKLGNPQAVMRLAQMQGDGHADQGMQVQAMVDGLAQRLRTQPDDFAGWAMLARSYETLERYGEAAQAYQAALAQAQHNQLDAEVQAKLLADMADALGSAAGGRLDGEAGVAIVQALKLQPTQPKALALAGSAAVARGDLSSARAHWQLLLAQLEPGSDIALRVQDDLVRLESLQSGNQR